MRASSRSRSPKRGEFSSAADERPVPEPIWKAPQETGSITITPCQPAVELRLMAARIAWEPSSFDEESTRKNIYFALQDGAARKFLEAQEDKLAKEGPITSCLAKEGLLKCKVGMKRLYTYDDAKRKTDHPERWSNWVVNVVVKLIGACSSGLSLHATDIQLVTQYQRPCPF